VPITTTRPCEHCGKPGSIASQSLHKDRYCAACRQREQRRGQGPKARARQALAKSNPVPRIDYRGGEEADCERCGGRAKLPVMEAHGDRLCGRCRADLKTGRRREFVPGGKADVIENSPVYKMRVARYTLLARLQLPLFRDTRPETAALAIRREITLARTKPEEPMHTAPVPDVLAKLKSQARERMKAENLDRLERHRKAVASSWRRLCEAVRRDLPGAVLNNVDCDPDAPPDGFSDHSVEWFVEIRLDGHWPILARFLPDHNAEHGWVKSPLAVPPMTGTVDYQHPPHWLVIKHQGHPHYEERGHAHSLGAALVFAEKTEFDCLELPVEDD
jgi:hypothetical protein